MASSSGVAGPCRGRRAEEGSSVGGPQHGWGCGLCRGRRVEGGSSVGCPRLGWGCGLCRGRRVEGCHWWAVLGIAGVVGCVGAVAWKGGSSVGGPRWAVLGTSGVWVG